jgi:hypothetical protein
MFPMNRRSVLAGLASGGALIASPLLRSPAHAGIELASAYQPPILKFKVERDGTPIGHVMERFTTVGDALQVDVDIAFEVKLAFITVYRYELRSREIWRDGRLVRLDSVTNDDGDPLAVAVRDRGNALAISGPSGDITAPIDILPSSYWHPQFTEQTRMLDSQLGRIIEFDIQQGLEERIEINGGRRILATRYLMRGDVDLDFWYDDKRRWRKMEFTIKGGRMEYFELTPSPVDQAKFDAPLTTGATLPAL